MVTMLKVVSVFFFLAGFVLAGFVFLDRFLFPAETLTVSFSFSLSVAVV